MRMISFSSIDETAALEIIRWRYEPPYDIYDFEDTPDTREYILDPQYNFYAMKDENDDLVGFCSFGEDGQVPGGNYALEALDIGMGIHPDLTGKGFGSKFAVAVLNFASRTFQPTTYRVTIASFNLRARRVWEKNGFQQIQVFTHKDSQREFTVMVREANVNSIANHQ